MRSFAGHCVEDALQGAAEHIHRPCTRPLHTSSFPQVLPAWLTIQLHFHSYQPQVLPAWLTIHPPFVLPLLPQVLPAWLTTVTLCLLLIFVSHKMLQKALDIRSKERRALQESLRRLSALDAGECIWVPVAVAVCAACCCRLACMAARLSFCGFASQQLVLITCCILVSRRGRRFRRPHPHPAAPAAAAPAQQRI